MEKPTVRCLITGAASGIGEAIAHRFGRAGMEIVGVDVDAAGSERVVADLRRAGIGAGFETVDLTDSEQHETLVARMSPLDTVVHSAGTSCVGGFGDAPELEQQRVIDLNLEAPIRLTTELLRREKIEPGGSLVFLSSLSRFLSYPGASVYAATKDGLAAYARGLAVALAPRRIHVATVYPGPTRTPHARRFSPDPDAEARRMLPETLARIVYLAVRRRRRVVIPGTANKMLATLGHIAPTLAGRLMKRVIYERLPHPARSSGGSSSPGSESG